MSWYRDDPLFLIRLTHQWIKTTYPKSDAHTYFCEDKDFLNAIKFMADSVYDEASYLITLRGFFADHYNTLTKISYNVSVKRIKDELLRR